MEVMRVGYLKVLSLSQVHRMQSPVRRAIVIEKVFLMLTNFLLFSLEQLTYTDRANSFIV
jgi:hypothetical protein